MTKAIDYNYYDEDKLTKEEVLFFKAALENKKVQIQKNINLTSENLNNKDSSNLKDEADHASTMIDTRTANAIIHEQNKSINQINRCLKKIEFGQYGICNVCEETIDIERLKVKIFAEHCISCRELIEKQQ